MNGDKERVEKGPGDEEKIELSAEPDKDQERIERGSNPQERMEKNPERAE